MKPGNSAKKAISMGSDKRLPPLEIMRNIRTEIFPLSQLTLEKVNKYLDCHCDMNQNGTKTPKTHYRVR